MPAGGSAAVSNDEGAIELYPSDPEVSESEDQADGSAGIIFLNVRGNQWPEDEALNSLDPRGPMAEAVRNPIFTLHLVTYQRKIDLDWIDYVDLFFHKQLFSTMIDHSNAKILDDAQKSYRGRDAPLHWNYVCYDHMSYEQYQRVLVPTTTGMSKMMI